MTDAVIFDFDGVLADSETLAVAVERAALAELGLHYGHEDYVARFCGLPDADFLTAIAGDLAHSGTAMPASLGDDLHRKRKAAYRTELKAIVGAAAFAQRLNVPKAVASSSMTDSLTEKLQTTGLYDLFVPYIFSTELVHNGKPAPDLFLYAAQRLDCPPAACLVVEDSVNGVRAGINAGMAVWGFIGGGHATPRLGELLRAAGASRVFADYATMQQAYLDRANAR